MASLRAESNQTTVVASLLARWIPFGALSLRSFRFFLLLFFVFLFQLWFIFPLFPVVSAIYRARTSLVICLITKITSRYLIFP